MEPFIFVHLSDLHFGTVGARRRFYRSLGRAPHRDHLASALPLALRDIADDTGLKSERDLHVLVSGDLTSGGANTEFAAVGEFLLAKAKSAPQDPGFDGLGLHADRLITIAGNHDHWDDGKWPIIPAFTPEIYHVHGYFAEPPWREDWSNGDNTIKVEVYGIDSSGGLEGETRNVNAVGKLLPKDLRVLDCKMKKADDNHSPPQVRIVVCHHSLAYGNSPKVNTGLYDQIFGANTLDDYSRERLLEICWRRRVGVILTGHIHRFPPPYPHDRRVGILQLDGWRVWELTCTSTTQDIAVEDEQNGFWVHSIHKDGAKLRWIPERWEWSINLARFVKSHTSEGFPLP